MMKAARLKRLVKDYNDEADLREAIELVDEPIPTSAPPGHVVIR